MHHNGAAYIWRMGLDLNLKGREFDGLRGHPGRPRHGPACRRQVATCEQNAIAPGALDRGKRAGGGRCAAA